ncbi:hypothetical protein [uncultured Duncaniella sp.]|uniref:hypothetical protein n=1 Tax=uncultured Duncaniella sp. TaxID=2768039 RepID=UPI00272D1BD5|nr:hypothetical protein [uncultured Duncaniella sp.]
MKKFNHLVSEWERNSCREVPDSFCAENVRLRLEFLRLRREILRQTFRKYYYLLN